MNSPQRGSSPSEPASTAGTIGPLRGVALYTGSLLGSGLLILPALAYRSAGPASILAWAGLLLLSIPVALTFGALGVRVPDRGGVSSYVRRAFGRRAGATTGLWFVLALPVGAPATTMVGGTYLSTAFGWGERGAFWCSFAVLLIAVLAAALGVKIAGTIQLSLVAVLVVVLGAAVTGAAPHLSTANLTPFMPHGWAGVLGAAGLLFFCFAGWEAVSPLAQEFKNPERDIKIVTRWALVLVSGIYLVLAVVSVAVLGPTMTAHSTPVEQLLSLGWGSAAPVVVGVLAVALTQGATMAYLSGGGSMAAALARDGWAPRGLAVGHERGATPSRAVCVIGSLALVVHVVAQTAGLPLERMMELASAMFVAVTLAGVAAGVRLLPGMRAKIGAGVATVLMAIVLAGCGIEALYPVAVALAVWIVAVIRRPRAS